MKPLLLVLLFNLTLLAQSFVKEYTYHASDNDSKITARKAALSQVKMLAIEEVGVTIRSSFHNYVDVEDEKVKKVINTKIDTVARNVTHSKILDESWNGVIFYIKAEIIIDPKEVGREIRKTVAKELHKLKEQKEATKERIPKKIVKPTLMPQLPVQTIQHAITPQLIHIAKGNFYMGSDEKKNEKPRHFVEIQKDFYLAKYEVTKREFRAFVDATAYKSDAQKEGSCMIYINNSHQYKEGVFWDSVGFFQTEDDPVVCVSYNDAHAYIKWLNSVTHEQYRLPSEAEWEYAARAGSDTAYAFDEKEYNNHVWYAKNSAHQTHKVGTKKPNNWNLYDMQGNVWEWVEDSYTSYNNTPSTQKPYYGSNTKVLRSKSWITNKAPLSYRWAKPSNARYYAIGFRLAKDSRESNSIQTALTPSKLDEMHKDIREKYFTTWMSQEVYQAEYSNGVYKNLYPAYIQTNAKGERRVLKLSNVNRFKWTSRSARSLKYIQEATVQKRMEGKRMLSLHVEHVGSQDFYSAVWIKNSAYDKERQRLATFGIY